MYKSVICIVMLLASLSCATPETAELSLEEAGADRGWICKKPLITDGISGKIHTGCTSNLVREYRLFTMPVAIKNSTTDSAALLEGCMKFAGMVIQSEGIGRTVAEIIEKYQGGVTDLSCTPGAIMIRYSEKLKEERGIAGCCAINTETGRCITPGEPVNTDSCVCLGYFKYAGGLDTLVDDFFKLSEENCGSQ